MEGPKIPQIRDLPDSENLDLRNKGGGFLRGGGGSYQVSDSTDIKSTL